MSGFGIGRLRRNQRAMQGVAGAVLLTYLSAILSPSALAMSSARTSAPAPATAQNPHAQLIDALQAQVNTMETQRTGNATALASLDADRSKLRSLGAAIKAEDDKTLTAFDTTETRIKDHHLPGAILTRHRDAVAAFKKESLRMQAELEAIDSATNAGQMAGTIQVLKAHLEQMSAAHHRRFDPKSLPFHKLKNPARKPRTTKEAFAGLFPTRLISGRILASTNPMLFLASASLLAAAPGPEFLAPTEDVQLTPAVTALATQLNNNPVAIYNWVRNSIAYVPTYGSVQGSDLTLQKMSGNAFDTSSLLIALLRAAGVPARYVYGTVQIPIAQVMNWVGVTDPDAAIDLFAQGGVPVTGLTQGGVVTAVQIEHVWVEAFVDYAPSRGAKNKTASSWAPMDASFKQNIETPAADFASQVPLDAAALAANADVGATIDEQDGWAEGISSSSVTASLSQYQQPLDAFMAQQSAGTSLAQVIGGGQVSAVTVPLLAATTPYHVVAVGSRFASFPAQLRSQFQYAMFTDGEAQALQEPIFQYTQDTVLLAGHKLTLAYVAASAADQQTLLSFLPAPHADGTPIQLSEIPTSLPAYLIHVTAELRVDGVAVASGGDFTLGQDLVGQGGFTTMDLSDWDLTTDLHLAGQGGGLGLSLEGVSKSQLAAVQSRLQTTSAQVAANNPANLSGEQLAGDVLYATVLQYLATLESFGQGVQHQANVVDLPGLSYGFFYAAVAPIKLYDVIVSNIVFVGGLMDVGHERRIGMAANGDVNSWIAYNRLRGIHASTMEHAVPELLYADSPSLVNDPTQAVGVSAVKALTIAEQQGQKIYQITQSNIAQLGNVSQSATVMSDLTNALAAGMEVVVSQAPISSTGFNGAGYIITDPGTGAGSYLIEDGSHGAKIAKGIITVVGIALLFFPASAVAGAAGLLALFSFIAVFVALYSVLLNAIEILDTGGACALDLAERYMEFWLPLTVVAALPIGKGIQALVFKLMAAMYGADLFKGVGNSPACHP